MTVASNVFSGPFSISAVQIAAVLGYTPANKAGDTFTGAVAISAGNSLALNGAFVVANGVTATGLASASATDTFGALRPTGIGAAAGNVIGWTGSTSNAFASFATSLSQISAGVVGVGTGANGSVAGEVRALNITMGASGFLKMGAANQLWVGNALVTGLVAATVNALVSKSIDLYDVAGNKITVYGS